MSRPWNLEGLMAARVLAAVGAPLGHIGQALDRFAPEIDQALWVLVGRTPEQALAVLNGDPSPVATEHPLQARLLKALGQVAATIDDLAEILGEDPAEVAAALSLAAGAGLVDAHEPPQPCGREAYRWFRPGMVRERTS